MIIRPAVEQDIKALAALEKFGDVQWGVNGLSHALDESYLLLISENEKRKISGFIILMILADEVHIANVVVRPEERGKGLATNLLLTAISMAQQQGVKHVTLEVSTKNTGAQALYSALGFEIAGKRKSLYSDGSDAFTMRTTVKKVLNH